MVDHHFTMQVYPFALDRLLRGCPKWLGECTKKVKKLALRPWCLGRDTPEHGNVDLGDTPFEHNKAMWFNVWKHYPQYGIERIQSGLKPLLSLVPNPIISRKAWVICFFSAQPIYTIIHSVLQASFKQISLGFPSFSHHVLSFPLPFYHYSEMVHHAEMVWDASVRGPVSWRSNPSNSHVLTSTLCVHPVVEKWRRFFWCECHVATNSPVNGWKWVHWCTMVYSIHHLNPFNDFSWFVWKWIYHGIHHRSPVHCREDLNEGCCDIMFLDGQKMFKQIL